MNRDISCPVLLALCPELKGPMNDDISRYIDPLLGEARGGLAKEINHDRTVS